MEEKKTMIMFGPGKPDPVTPPKPVGSTKDRPLLSRCNTPVPPNVNYRQTGDGRPSNGDPQDFENDFSMTDASGVRYDFREGLRIMISASMEGTHEIIAEDALNGFVHFRVALQPGGSVTSRKKWFVPWRFEVRKDGATVMEHVMDLKGREVAIHYPPAGMGDTVAWFSYAERFAETTGCSLTCCIEERFQDLFRDQYPTFNWAGPDAWRTTPFYAVYHMGIFTPDNECDRQPDDFRLTGLHHAAGHILGLPEEDMPPRVSTVAPKRPVPDDPYVCIATNASARCKEWLNPNGWVSVVSRLKELGYNVVDIDRDFVHGQSSIPNGVEDDTGDIDLRERAAVLKGAKAFVGVSSGLAWLAWACGTPVVLISGWTLPYTEFRTPFRVINRCVCHGCWNDPREEFDHYDDNYCPRHRDTARQHECSTGISGRMVWQALSRALGVDE